MSAGLPLNKLHIKPGIHISIINSPPEYKRRLGHYVETNGPFNFIQLFIWTGEELDQHLPKVIDKLQPQGILWISYPKLSSDMKSDISRDNCRDITQAFDYRTVSQISIDETWSALRFKPGQSVISKNLETPLVDAAARRVKIPKELKNVFSCNRKMETFFNPLSFPHRKEYTV